MYMIPRTFAAQQNNDECVLFNHSCEPNCGFDTGDGNTIVASRDIAVGEELTYDYHFLETEPSLIRGLECKCETPLHALEWIHAGEVVARFSGAITPENHFIRAANETDATCVVDEYKQVIALCDLPPEAEITLNYHGKL